MPRTTFHAARRAARALATAAVFLVASAGAARAEHLNMRGHMSFGYGKLFAPDAPGGSLSVAAGLDFPFSRPLSAGVEVGYNLLGGRSVQRGSLFADLDYSAFEVLAMLRWTAQSSGPAVMLAAGPGLFHA